MSSLFGLNTSYTANKVDETALDRREVLLNNLNPNREQTQRTLEGTGRIQAQENRINAAKQPNVLDFPGAHKSGSLNTAIQSYLNKPAPQVQPVLTTDSYSGLPVFDVDKNQNPSDVYGL